MIKGICMRDVTHLYSDNIFPRNIIKLRLRHGNEEGEAEEAKEEDTNNVCREILVETLLSDLFHTQHN